MQVTLSSGNYDIIAHGQTFLFGPEEDLSIDIDTQEDFKFSIILKFQQDESGMQEIRQNLEKNKIILSCKNFKDEGTGTPAPVDIVEIDGKKMYFMFWSFLDGEKARSVRYTLFVER